MLVDLGRVLSCVVGLGFVVGACGDSLSEPSPAELRVAGTYDTQVALQQSTCTGIAVQRFTTVVTHAPGASALTIAHAGNTYSGTVQRTGAFTTTPKAITGGGETHTLTITGTFTTTAMDATVTADVQRTGAATCQYTVKWTGPKQGEPNVIP